MKVPDAPGLGVELDREKLAFLHRRCLDDDGSLRERDDAAAMRGAEPGWETPAVPLVAPGGGYGPDGCRVRASVGARS
ncbi:UNVERIFIED_CONTAM: hypothetical protein RKD50_009197 [Streptomyces canus]